MPTDALFAAAKATPYWWEDAPRAPRDDTVLPRQADVVVIGGGYTGLSAARETARAGRNTVVIDAEAIGWGCSSRNGGQVSTSIKPAFSDLSGKHNEDLAFRIRREGINALDFTRDLIRSEGIDCDWRQVGRFHAAHTRKHYDALAAAAKDQPKGLEVAMEMVPKAEQGGELASPLYHGGMVVPGTGAVHPAKLADGLASLARQAGATLISHARVDGITRDGGRLRVHTKRGDIDAGDVLIATNGYTGTPFAWQRRRVIPIGSYILATEPLAGGARRYIPRERMISDTRRVVIYYRSSPDGQRLLFGGRARLSENNPLKCLPKLHSMMCEIHPDLRSARVTHAWMGFVAYTFDKLPHIGNQDGLWYAMGYCGSGVSLANYFGTRIGQQIVGKPEGRTALDGLTFETRPLYDGRPWFLAASVGWFRLLDQLGV